MFKTVRSSFVASKDGVAELILLDFLKLFKIKLCIYEIAFAGQ